MQSAPSYWEHSTFLAPFDILIVGSGIVGCVAALHCAAQAPGLRIGVVERGTLPTGASTRNAGFAAFGSMTEILSDMKTMDEQATFDLIAKRKTGLDALLRLVPGNKYDYQNTGGYEVFLEDDQESYHECLSVFEILNEKLAPLFGGDPFVPDDSVAFQMGLHNVAHVVRHPYEGLLHPGKLIFVLIQMVQAAGISFLNGFDLYKIREESSSVEVRSKSGVGLKASYVIIATNAFAGQLIPDLAIQPARNQVYVTSPIQGLKLRGCYHYDHGFIYFREVDGRVLIGGARNTDFANENTAEFGLTEAIRHRLTGFLDQHILYGKSYSIDHAWSGIIGIGPEKGPIVRMAGERIVVAVRLSGIGIAIGSLIGVQAAQLILSRI